MKNFTLILLLSLLLPFGCRHNQPTNGEMQSKHTPLADNTPKQMMVNVNQPSESIIPSNSIDSVKSLKADTSPLTLWLEKALQDTLSRNEGNPQLDFSNHTLHIYDTITGDFNGDGNLESAHCFSYGVRDENSSWDGYGIGAAGVFFNDTNMPFFIVRQPFTIGLLMNEKDLMGDASDEIGFFASGAFSLWGVWVVYSYIDGKWAEIVNFSHNPDFDDYFKSDPLNREDLVRLDPNNKDYILVKELMMEDGDFVRKMRSVKIKRNYIL